MPATKRGLHAATTDAEAIEAWWTHRPEFNIGISTGPAGLLVVDLDLKGDVNGFVSWCDLLDARDAAPVFTYTVTTPSGGLHFYYSLEPGWMIGNSASKLGPGIDVRAQGGYVVAPPSETAAGLYEVDDGFASEVAPAPLWLLDALKAPPAPRVPTIAATGDSTPYGLAALDRELGTLAVAGEGTRNDQLVRAAFRLGRLVAGAQLDAGHVTGQLLVVALRIGLSEREAVSTLRSGLEAGMRNPRVPS